MPMTPNQKICWNLILLSKLLATALYLETKVINAIFFLEKHEAQVRWRSSALTLTRTPNTAWGRNSYQRLQQKSKSVHIGSNECSHVFICLCKRPQENLQWTHI